MSFTLRPPMSYTVDGDITIITEWAVPYDKNKRFCVVQGPVESPALVVFPGAHVAVLPKNWVVV